MRLLQAEDIAPLVKINQDKTSAIGMPEPFWLPPLSDPRVEKAFVFEREGEVVGALIFRRVWEIMHVSNEPATVKCAVQNNDKIREVLARAGIDSVVGWIPSKLIEGERSRGMEKLIKRAGFRRLHELTGFETEVHCGTE